MQTLQGFSKSNPLSSSKLCVALWQAFDQLRLYDLWSPLKTNTFQQSIRRVDALTLQACGESASELLVLAFPPGLGQLLRQLGLQRIQRTKPRHMQLFTSSADKPCQLVALAKVASLAGLVTKEGSPAGGLILLTTNFLQCGRSEVILQDLMP